MKNQFTQKLLLLAITLFALTACSDDEVKTKGSITLEDESTKIASGLFVYDTSPNTDAEDNDYYRNQIIFVGKGLKIETSGDEYEVTGSGNMLELYVNNAGTQLETGTYTWQSEENEQPFDLWSGWLTLDVNSEDETYYRLIDGTVTVTKSGGIYKMSFEGTAYLYIESDKQAAGLPTVNVSAEFEGKLKRFGFDF